MRDGTQFAEPRNAGSRRTRILLFVLVGLPALLLLLFLGTWFALLVSLGDPGDEDRAESAAVYQVPSDTASVTECGVGDDGLGHVSVVVTDLPVTDASHVEVVVRFVDPDGMDIGRAWVLVPMTESDEQASGEVRSVQLDEGSTLDGCEIS